MRTIDVANCNCNTEIDARIGEQVKTLCLPVKEFITRSSDVMSNRLVLHLMQAKSGRVAKNTVEISYCPFCGVKYKSREEIAQLRKEIENEAGVEGSP